jgi:uncharacterized membrane protein YfcA
MTTPLTLIVLVMLVLWLAAFVRSAVGFGDALLAMPLLALLLGLQVATPLVGLTGLVISLIILSTSWRQVDVRNFWRLTVASLVGMPFGIWLLQHGDERVVNLVLGLLLVAYGAYNLSRPTLPALRSEAWAYPFGFVAGVLGSAYNTSGPPVVIYGAMRRWPPDLFRATLQGFFLVSNVIVIAGHGLAGLWTQELLLLTLVSLPVLLSAIAAGAVVNRRIPAAQFTRVVNGLLVLVGALFLLQVWR